MRIGLEGELRGVTMESDEGNEISVAVARDDVCFNQEFFSVLKN